LTITLSYSGVSLGQAVIWYCRTFRLEVLVKVPGCSENTADRKKEKTNRLIKLFENVT